MVCEGPSALRHLFLDFGIGPDAYAVQKEEKVEEEIELS
jgi:hypothetical protein